MHAWTVVQLISQAIAAYHASGTDLQNQRTRYVIIIHRKPMNDSIYQTLSSLSAHTSLGEAGSADRLGNTLFLSLISVLNFKGNYSYSGITFIHSPFLLSKISCNATPIWFSSACAVRVCVGVQR